MKISSVSKLTLAALIAVQLLHVDVVSANAFRVNKNFTQVLKTHDLAALSDPGQQIASVSVREISEEEARSAGIPLKFMDRTRAISTFGNKPPKIPNVPPIPPSDSDIAGGIVPPAIAGGIVPPSATPSADGPTPQPTGAIDGIIMVIDKLIAIGQKIIPMIKDGKSIVTNNPMTSVSVLPRSEAKDPVVHDMGGWTIPVSKHYAISYKNGWGMEVVNFVYSISYQYNGSQDGKGKYLAGIRASARNINVDWGFDVDASSQLLQISNVGTQENVVAGATIEMSYTVKNWTRTVTSNVSFFVSGDGQLHKLD